MSHTPLWTAASLAAVTGGRLIGSDRAVTGVSIDTRTLQAGDVFIALRGPHLDGHEYIAAARAKGATCVIAEHGSEEGTIVVADTFQALQDMGRGARARSKARVFAITGSVGKTSTKEMLARCLSLLGETHAAQASLNNHWGVPLSLARMPVSAQFGVFELGMNHANEITPLSKMTAPHIALITTIASAHIENLGSVENIARAKSEIFHGMETDGVAILPRDNPQFPILLAEARTQGLQHILTFGSDPGSDVRLLDARAEADMTHVHFSYQGKSYDFTLGLAGVHQAMNALAVVAAVAQVTDDITRVLPVLAELTPVSGRGNRWPCLLKKGQPPLLVIDETHNASPVAVRAALDVLARIPTNGRRLVALGDMLELGAVSAQEHAALKEPLLAAHVDHVFTCGKRMAHLAEVLPFGRNTHFADSAALAAHIAELVRPGDVLLLKGSHGSKMKLVIDALQSLSQSAEMALSPG